MTLVTPARSHFRTLVVPTFCSVVALMAACGGGGGGGDTSGGAGTTPPPAAATYTVGGTVTGMRAASSVVLKNNGGDATTVSADGTFQFPTAVKAAAATAITVDTQPLDQICTVSNGTVASTSANVSATVACVSTVTMTHAFTAAPDLQSPYYVRLVQGADGSLYGTGTTGGAHNAGAIFKTTTAGAETIVHSFDPTAGEGSTPNGGLFLGSDGNYYGTTNAGGANSLGTVFKMTPAGVLTTLVSLGAGGTGGNDAKSPESGVVMLSNGNLYGTTRQGGDYNQGTVYMVTPGSPSVEIVLYSFGLGTDGSSPWGDLAVGADGNLYGVTIAGGVNGKGEAYKITPAGVKTSLYSFGATATDAATPKAGLIRGADGNLYGTTELGGTFNKGTIYKLTPAGVETVLYSFGTATSDGTLPQSALTQLPNGDFYGTTNQAGSCGYGTVFKLSAAGVMTTVYAFGGVPNDPLTPNGPLTLASDGNLYGTAPIGGGLTPASGALFKLPTQ